jgi:hypothetical protein
MRLVKDAEDLEVPLIAEEQMRASGNRFAAQVRMTTRRVDVRRDAPVAAFGHARHDDSLLWFGQGPGHVLPDQSLRQPHPTQFDGDGQHAATTDAAAPIPRRGDHEECPQAATRGPETALINACSALRPRAVLIRSSPLHREFARPLRAASRAIQTCGSSVCRRDPDPSRLRRTRSGASCTSGRVAVSSLTLVCASMPWHHPHLHAPFMSPRALSERTLPGMLGRARAGPSTAEERSREETPCPSGS